jgi:DNA repair protein RadC
MEKKITQIKDLPLLDRPREKLLREGAASLTNAELIAILFGSGNKNMPVMSICRELVSAINNNAANLHKMSIKELSGFKGIGEIKAITLIAALELGKRSLSVTPPISLKEDKAIETLIAPYFSGNDNIQYFLVLMNHRNELLATSELLTEQGKLPKLNPVIRLCLEAGATTIMICRNELVLDEKYLSKEKAFVIQLDAAASMLKIKMRGLLIVDQRSCE